MYYNSDRFHVEEKNRRARRTRNGALLVDVIVFTSYVAARLRHCLIALGAGSPCRVIKWILHKSLFDVWGGIFFDLMPPFFF
jgi:hypothetical protein